MLHQYACTPAYHLGIGRARATVTDETVEGCVAYHLGIGRARATGTILMMVLASSLPLGNR